MLISRLNEVIIISDAYLKYKIAYKYAYIACDICVCDHNVYCGLIMSLTRCTNPYVWANKKNNKK